ncbi:MAG: insulinase family protein [Actinomycetota bacterium]|nr:insulinase family protein [Actinomycetota bacterium]
MSVAPQTTGDEPGAVRATGVELYAVAVASLRESVVENGLPLVELGIDGTRAVTVLVAFDAGARAERPEENGIAHFLEHLVFKGSERYPSHREITRTAERLGARVNAYTSHDLVAFHVTCRAEAVMEAADLLTDFVARPLLDPDGLERERGVVIQEIAQSDDQPPRVASNLLDRAAHGEHPLGRAILGPREHLESFSREAVLGFRERRWAPARGAAFVAGNVSCVEAPRLAELFGRFPARPGADRSEPAHPFERRVLAEERDTEQSHLRLHWPAPIDFRDPAQRAALTVYATLLGGSMGSRLFDEIREQRGLCYSIWAHPHVHADFGSLRVGAGLESGKCVEAYQRIVEIVHELAADGPRPEEVERVRPYAAGSLVLALERSQTVAGRAADRRIILGETGSPEEAIAALDAVTEADVREVARAISGAPTVACVGPHEAADFE